MSDLAAGSWVERIRAATVAFNWSELSEIVEQYVRHLRSTEDLVPQGEASEILGLLRGVRRYAEVHAVADALLGHGLNEAVVKRQFAQALVDRDSPAAALLVYQGILDDPSTPEGERPEAMGGVGRCHKQLYLLDQVSPRRRRHLPSALTAYRAAYDEDHGHYWHGINVAALLARADRDAGRGRGRRRPGCGVSTGRSRGARRRPERATRPGVWELATACEAAVALGDHDLAIATGDDAGLEARRRHVHPRLAAAPAGRAVGARHRRAAGSGPVCRCCDRPCSPATAARSSSTRARPARRGPRLADYRERGRQEPRGGAGSRAVQGDDVVAHRARTVSCSRPDREHVRRPHRHWIPGRRQAAEPRASRPASWSPTATSCPRPCRTVRPSRSSTGSSATRQSARRKFEVVRWWWYQSSRAPDLDITILELDAYPDNVTPMPLAVEMPRLGTTTQPRAYVIGHPSGLDTPQFSLQDNLLIDYDDDPGPLPGADRARQLGQPGVRRHLEPDRGPPRRGLETPKLHGDGGTYPANEGIAVTAIKAKLVAVPPRSEEVTRQT